MALTPVVVVLLAIVALYLPPVQQWAVQRVCRYASERTGMNVTLERLRLTPLLDLDLQGTLITTPPDTVLAVRHAVADLDFRNILQGRLGVEELSLRDGVIDTRDLIATVVVKGKVGDFRLKADDIALKEQTVTLNNAVLDGCDVDIAMRDTTVVDTTESSPVPWSIDVRGIEARRTRIAFHTVGDSLCVRGGIRNLVAKGGDVDLGRGIYKAGLISLSADSLSVDMIPTSTESPTQAEFIDYNHLAFQPIELEVENLYYEQEGNRLSANIRQLGGRERSGMEVTQMHGNVRLDDSHIEVTDLLLVTSDSNVKGQVDMDWSALTAGERGRMNADVDARIGRRDLMAVAGQYLSADIKKLIPQDVITLSARATGNVDSMRVEDARVMISPMVEARFSGLLTNVLDAEKMGAEIDLDAESFDLTMLKKMLGLPKNVNLPKMNLKGKAGMQGQTYTADLRLQQGRGVALIKGKYDAKTEEYQAKLDLRNLNLRNFMPKDSLGLITARANVSGRGTDLYSVRTKAKAEVEIGHLGYGRNDIDNVRLVADLTNGDGQLNLYSGNDVLKADACANIKIKNGERNPSNIDFNLSLSYIDLHALGITDKPFAMSMLMESEGKSNLGDTHQISGSIKTIELNVEEGTFYPTDIDLTMMLAPDTIFADVTSGDLDLQVASANGWEQVAEKASALVAEVERQWNVHKIDQDTLKSLLPELTIKLHSGNKNTMAKIVETMGYTFDRLNFDLVSHPEVGLNGHGKLHALNTGAIQLDTVQWNIYQDTANVVRLDARVKNGPRNKQVAFEAGVAASVTPSGAEANIKFFDAKGEKGVDLGTQVFLEDDGYRVHLQPLTPILAYRRFTLNEGNYIYLHDDKRLEADVDLLADDGTGFRLYSTPNDEALQDITLSVHDFNIGELSNVIPYMPQLGGLLAGDFHLVQDEQSMSVLVDAQIGGFAYEGVGMGNIGLNAVYLPNHDGTHYVDGIVSHDGNEVALLVGTYNPQGEGTIDAKATLQRLPLTLANGFMPDQTLTLNGYVTGDLDVTGAVSSPRFDGAIVTDSMRLTSEMYSLALRFPDDTISIRHSHLNLNRIEAYSTGRNPLVLDGSIDLNNLDRIGLNLSLSGRNFELINAPKSPRSIAYGKVYVDLSAKLTGTLQDMLLRGRLNVLGNTDVTYVLTDSPLTVEDELAELVTFVDFSDTLAVEEVKTSSPQNIDMQMNIGIEQAAQVHCLLSQDGNNYIDLEGGGELTMNYTTQDNLEMFGRYTIVSGLMNYSLMVMSLKNFAIQNGSYVEFSGPITNPKLSIKASERIKTTVYEENVPRSVNFDVGLSVSQTLENMGLEFTLEAPSDMNISNQLASMSAEERGKVAVTMLATGMYLTESGNGTNGFSATNALNSFLQTQIAAISNKALSTIDLNFGIDNTNTASGGMQTDYNFSFAKRFWGNRISLIIGGKVSSGSEAVNTGQSIINNVSLEYRLDKSATRYVRIYYDRDTESLLEGEVTEMGAGVVFRRKSTRLGELFMFRRK